MKGDISRWTFVQGRHYSGVLMQQGRVQVDADWNEQQAIQQYRVETEATDVIGPCGAPADAPGFEISAADTTLTIGRGQYYVDGILCENDSDVAYEKQPHSSAALRAEDLALEDGVVGLVYLDVWRRHVSALEDDYLREKALGGPDTATRVQTVWQTRVTPVRPDPQASTIAAHADELTNLLVQRHELRDKLGKADDAVATADTLADLEEVTGKIADLLAGLSCDSAFEEWDRVVASSTGALDARAHPPEDQTDPCVIPPGARYRGLENQLYRVEIHTPGGLGSAGFVWSRDNGSVAVAWKGQSGAGNEYLTVKSTGRSIDEMFAGAAYVELTDDAHELAGTPGTVVRLVKAEGEALTIDPGSAVPGGAPVALANFAHNPKVRRWDGAGIVEIPAGNDGWLALEDGVEIAFSSGTYHTGDYWLIPARTATGDVEWPPYEDPAAGSDARPPCGIGHHYCRLALVGLGTDGHLHVLTDCRRLFPPLTGLVDFYYVGGDGQEAMPDLTNPGSLVPLEGPLQVGVSNWRWPVEGQAVLFQIKAGNGRLVGGAGPAGSAVTVLTDADGVAACPWELDPTTQDQRVEAMLLDLQDRPMQTPVRFHANLSLAREVAYDPSAACGGLQGAVTVQSAIDRLSGSAALAYVGGDGQLVRTDSGDPALALPLEQPLEVAVTSLCGPLAGRVVVFKVTRGNGRLLDGDGAPGPRVKVTTRAGDGIATCRWQPDRTTADQQVEATLAADGDPLTAPVAIRFSAGLPPAAAGGCRVTVGVGGRFATLEEALKALLEKGTKDICICLLPGDHEVGSLDLTDPPKSATLAIGGCGAGTRVHTEKSWELAGLASFSLADLWLEVRSPTGLLTARGCDAVSVQRTRVEWTQASSEEVPLLAVAGARSVEVAHSALDAPMAAKDEGFAGIFAGLDERVFKLFSVAGPEKFSREVGGVAESLAGLNVRARQGFAKKLLKALDVAAGLGPDEQKLGRELAAVMAERAVEGPAVLEVLNRGRDLPRAAVPGTALELDCAGADIRLLDNEVFGVVSLCGRRVSEDLNRDHLELFAKGLHSGVFTFARSAGTLRLRGNGLTRLSAGARMVDQIRQLLADTKGSLTGAFREAAASENSWRSEEQGFTALVAESATLASNAVQIGDGGEAGAVIAVGATYCGNQAANPDVVLWDVSMFNQGGANKAANVRINIVAL